MKIKELRKAKGISQEQVANGLGVSVRAYQNYEYGQREPNIEMINKIANFYGVTTDYLLGRESEPLGTPIDTFAKDANLKELEKILITRYLELSDKQREAVLDFMRNAISEEEARKAAFGQSGIKYVMQAARNGSEPGLVATTDEEEAKLLATPLLDPDL